MSMTLSEFEQAASALACQQCGAVGLALDRNTNNGGVRPSCAACGTKAPLAGVQWLSQGHHKPRRLPGSPSGPEVWTANGNHCAFCGKPRALCERLRIGLTAQHIVPVVFGGEGPLIPFCARCQEASAAALKETRNILGEIESLEAIIKRIEEKNTDLLP